eukprot:CAMPEP_0172043012 /NCGR_PEP_ID=MMETSP1041-20130122/26017_1 /TAXON_ID=464988 /ORGANISM="Hemiselmis andersenii, Strain CCMP439" /LENGTH=62 /DNA_ID=CAMNT_0012701373 /DNA_START=107 /DNA_END=292 /DNA_ORIENTATION=-
MAIDRVSSCFVAPTAAAAAVHAEAPHTAIPADSVIASWARPGKSLDPVIRPTYNTKGGMPSA